MPTGDAPDHAPPTRIQALYFERIRAIRKGAPSSSSGLRERVVRS